MFLSDEEVAAIQEIIKVYGVRETCFGDVCNDIATLDAVTIRNIAEQNNIDELGQMERFRAKCAMLGIGFKPQD